MQAEGKIMPETKTITLDLKQFTGEVAVAGFLGAWKFWKVLKEAREKTGVMTDRSLDQDARGILTGIGALALPAVVSRGKMSPQEREAFADLGLLTEKTNGGNLGCQRQN